MRPTPGLPQQGALGQAVPVAASSTSGLTVGFDARPAEGCALRDSDAGPRLVLLAEGPCHVTVSQPGDATRAPAPDVEAVLDILPAARPTESRDEVPAGSRD